MSLVLADWDERMRGEVSRFDRLVPEAEARGSVLRDPATEDEVAAAEERLGVRFPPSYRAFLLVSNGAFAGPIGAEIVGQNERHGFLQAQEVQPTTVADALGVEIWCDQMAEDWPEDQDDPPRPGEPAHVGYYEPYRHGFVISHRCGTDRMALVPREGQDEWEAWSFHWEGAFAHASFADFLEWTLRQPDQRPKPELADEYVRAYRAEEWFTLDHLAEIGDPRAVELGVEALEAGSDDTRILRLLGRWGDPAYLPILRKACEPPGDVWWRATAASAIQLLAPEEGTALMQAMLSDPDARLREWAAFKLGRPPDAPGS